jgi:hypothetical protein
LKRIGVGVLVALSVAFIGAADARPPGRSIDMPLTASATAGDVHSGMAQCWALAGSVTFQTLGRMTYTGFDIGVPGSSYCLVGPNISDGSFTASFSLQFTGANGGGFTVSGSTVVPLGATAAPPGSWTISDPTGRLIGLSGSGTFTLGEVSPTDSLDITLTGSFAR